MAQLIPYQAEIVSAAKQNNVPPSILAGLLAHESGFNAHATGQDVGSLDRGIAQINSKAYPNVSNAEAYNPYYAIPFAAQTLASHYKTCGSYQGALEAYNSGQCQGDTGYSSAVLQQAKKYQSLNGGLSSIKGIFSGSTGGLQSNLIKYGLMGILVVFGLIAIIDGMKGD